MDVIQVTAGALSLSNAEALHLTFQVPWSIQSSVAVQPGTGWYFVWHSCLGTEEEAIATRVEAIAIRLEAIVTSLGTEERPHVLAPIFGWTS